MTKKLTKNLVFKAMKVASVVGTVLLIINQYDALFGDAELRLASALLTYCVPFVVFLSGKLSKD
ncbi:MAG: nitrate/nitrite transporter NrtS [Marinomonas sp.]|jgi:methyl-accepting chemotaxis protein|uniref:nitrate/nitrite transporter NrtS n=1 Tax=unclassified Marinomonas TaxID=196814 RepID=UPI0005FA2FB3|nr:MULTISPECIES: nitrate/nitrite transporter NrtS [unclassified Marinomonas]KJZ13716.1 dihydrolipoamide dehydrogenase [Marinomonas sp. S3726]KZM44876.1 dihydrolipoamide dehydrogenase [Marinomonas sp. SBI22]KZM46575.1 dihydrolipoamide dehydrogenase [Marinomonas sp. SBI8L]